MKKKHKKIFFLFSQPYEDFNYKRFSFKLLKKHGFEPIYVDLSGFFLKKDHKYRNQKKSKVIKINSIRDFIKFLNNNKKTFFYIDLVSYNSFFYNLFQKILSFRGCIKIHLSTSIISQSHLLNPREKIKIYLTKFMLLKLLISILRFILKKLNSLISVKPDIAFVSGNVELQKFYGQKNVYASCSLDYNSYIENKKNIVYKKFNQIVYLDQNLMYHREFFITKEGEINKKNFISFYNKLKFFLKQIQKNEKCKIVICLHPRTKNAGIIFLKKIFNDKKIIFSKNTSSEIQKSKFIIFNYSNAHQLGVLYHKPMLIVHNFSPKYYDYELKSKVITQIKKELGIPVLNLNKKFQNYHLKYNINKFKYKKYIQNYLSLVYPQKVSSWKIIIDKLNKNYDL